MEENNTETNKYFEYTKCIIEPNIHKFLYVLVKYLFYGKKYMSNAKNKLASILDKLNLKYLDSRILENNNCSIDYLKAIFDYIKTQNFALACEIFENIMIRVLSFAFNSKNDEFFGKYLYNNLELLKTNKKILIEWINNELLKPIFNSSNKTLKQTIEIDEHLLNISNGKYDKIPNQLINAESLFFDILLYVYKSKKIINNKKNGNSDLNSTTTTTFSGVQTTIYTQQSEFYYGDGEEIGKKNRDSPLILTLTILISAYIYYQNRKSPLIKYSENKENLENLPFVFDISEAGISDFYSNAILSPIRNEPSISVIELNKNKYKDYGIYELHKVLVFNKSINVITLSGCTTKSVSLNTFKNNYLAFNNYNVNELDLSSNYLKSDSDTNLSKLITYFKGLKILALSNNSLKSGLGYFFATLKNLYRKNKTKLEELYLVNCELDDISFYELGELLKSKYCKLKCLCLNENKIPSDVNFFKALKKNRSLEEIYFYGCGINSEKTDEIERIINNTNLEYLYFSVNQIHDFNQYIRIIYRTTLIKNGDEKKNNNIIINKPSLFNLNINNGKCYNQNIEKLNIMLEGFKNTNLSVLDLSSVLIDPHIENNNVNFNYYKGIQKMQKYLKEKQDEYKKALKEILESRVDKVKNNNNLMYKDMEEFKIFDSKILECINDENLKYKLRIKEKANELISTLNINSEEKKEKKKKLINYIALKIAEKKFEENDKIKSSKSLIII